MALRDHIKELKRRVLFCVGFFFLFSFLGYNYSGTIMSFITDMGASAGYHFIYLAPQELFMQYFKVSLLIGFIFDLPIILYELLKFVLPGSSKKTCFICVAAAVASGICFLAGAYFSYRIVLPFMLEFFSTVDSTGTITASISVQQYISFFSSMLLTFGFVAQVPVFASVIASIGMLKASWMLKANKYVLVIILVLSAIITPPDVISQLLVAIPMVGLYEVSIVIVKLIENKRRKAQCILNDTAKTCL